MRSVTILAAVLALSLAAFASPVLAGGWAVTTFDDLPGEFVSGKEYLLGYTIRQHGQTPINVDKTEILAVANSGRTLSFPGKSEGAVGHYIATVFFPASGTYTWQVTQGGFAAQDLGTITILAAGASTSDKAAMDKAAADKALPADKAAAAEKATAAEKAAVADKAAAAEKASASDKAAAAEKAALSDKAIAPAAPASATGVASTDPIRSALPFAAAAAAAMFIWRLVTMARSARRTRATT
ncbi:MAG: hypothetical protein ACRDF9_12970 [Candidatus Limnocylindria bacterium]